MLAQVKSFLPQLKAANDELLERPNADVSTDLVQLAPDFGISDDSESDSDADETEDQKLSQVNSERSQNGTEKLVEMVCCSLSIYVLFTVLVMISFVL